MVSTLCDVPKGISPNADGDNDSWNLKGLDVDKVKIFNRYGMLVYEQVGYVDQWSGHDKEGRELPSATYYYLLELATGESKTGWVYLQRK
jgi:gliding motility-associated-like protein